MRQSSTGAETDTFPKDGENVRSSKLSADLANRTRKWPTEKVAVVHGGVRCSDVQGTASHGGRRKPQKRDRKEKKAVSREGLSPVRMHRASSRLRHTHQLEHVP